MKTKYQDKPIKELEKALAEKREALSAFRFNISGTRTTNVKEGKNLRREIAQLMTYLANKSKTS